MPTGSVIPTLTGYLTGLKNGDTFPATFSTTATASSPIGSYPITGQLSDNGGKLANYTVTVVPGTLSLVQRQFTAGAAVTANVGPAVSTTIDLGTWLDADAANWPTSYSATVTWAPNTTPQPAQVTVTGASISVRAAHPFGVTGSYRPVVTIFDAGGSSLNQSPTVRADYTPARSTVSAPGGSATSTFTVNLNATDIGSVTSGVREFAVFVSANGGAYSLFGTYPAVNGQASFTYTGTTGSYYDFRSISTDNMGNVETKTGSDARTVMQGDPTIVTTSSASPANFGQALTLTVTVSGAGVVPTGTVEFYDTTTLMSLGTATLNNSGIATLTSSTMAVGIHALEIRYSGSSSYRALTTSFSQAVRTSIYVTNASTTPTPTGKLYLATSAQINIPGRIVVNSPTNPAITLSNNSQLIASSIQVVGVVQKAGTATINPAPVTGAGQAVADPLSGLPVPSLTGTEQSVVMSSGSMTINPGIYSSIKLSGTAQLTMTPGIYVIKGGGISTANSASLTGVGVMIYNASSAYPATTGSVAPVSLRGTGTLNLSAPATGVYAGVAIFQARTNSSTMTISGTLAQSIVGTIYSPASILTISGSIILRSALVVNQLTVSGTVQILGSGNTPGSGVISGTPNSVAYSGPAGVVAYDPSQIRTAYGINQIPPSLSGAGQTIAIVTAFAPPSLFESVDAFGSRFSLRTGGLRLSDEFGPASGFLSVVKVARDTDSALPAERQSVWAAETLADVQWAHAAAPAARIVVVQATSDSLGDLMTASRTAAGLPGVSVVSMSFGFEEGVAITADQAALYDKYFQVPGVVFVASSGNSGRNRPQYPATSPYVVAVGGTSAMINPDGTLAAETLWANPATGTGSGAGESLFQQRPAYQTAATSRRSTPDVSLAADPATGFWVADVDQAEPFTTTGGTSLATPIWAGILAMINQLRASSNLPTLNTASPVEAHEHLYALPSTSFNQVIDITEKSSISRSSGLGTPKVDRLMNQTGSLIAAPSTSPQASDRLSGVIGSVQASPIASVAASHENVGGSGRASMIQNGLKGMKRPMRKSAVAPAAASAEEATKAGRSSSGRRKAEVRFSELAGKAAKLAGAAKVQAANRQELATDEALLGLEAARTDSSQAIDTVFDEKSTDFWAARTGYRQYLKKSRND
jgi:hypothetical protein